MSSKILTIDKLFAERLKDLIDNQLKISRVEFSNKVGISEAYISMILAGRRGPSAELIAGLHIHYGKYLTWLLTGEKEIPIKEQKISEGSKESSQEEKMKQVEARLAIIEKLLSESKPNPGRRWYDGLILVKQ